MNDSIPLHVVTCNKNASINDDKNLLEDTLQLCKAALETIERYPVVLQEFKEKVKFLRTTPKADRNHIVLPHPF